MIGEVQASNRGRDWRRQGEGGRRSGAARRHRHAHQPGIVVKGFYELRAGKARLEAERDSGCRGGARGANGAQGRSRRGAHH